MKKKPGKRPLIKDLPFKLSINKSAYLEQTAAQSLKGVNSYFNLIPYHDENTYNDFEIREAFAYDIASSLGIDNDNPKELFIYVEYPNNYLDQLDSLRDAGSTRLYNEVRHVIERYSNSATSGINMRLNELNINAYKLKGDIPSHLSGLDRLTIISINQKANIAADPIASNFTWLFIHELYHTLLDSSDEQLVQRHTFDYLYNIGFYDEIGLEFIYDYYREYILGKSSWAVDYSTVYYTVTKLKELGDYDLLYAYLIILYELLLNNNYTDNASYVMDWINELPMDSYNEDTYKGVWL